MDEILTDEVKEELLDIVPESALPEIEETCAIYLRIKEEKHLHPKQEKEHLDKLKTAAEEIFVAQDKIRQLLEVTPLLPSLRLRRELKLLSPGLMIPRMSLHEAIKEATEPRAIFLKMALEGVLTPSRNPDAAGHYLASDLIDIYEYHTGKRARRSYDPYHKGDYGPIHNIAEILDPVLECGSMTAIIRKQLNRRKEIGDLLK